MTRSVLMVLAAVSVFLFPWPYVTALVFLAALYVPLIGISLGVIYDALYYTQGGGWPVATLAGIVGSVAAFFLARFIRSRIADVSL
ncbi:MAG TPA: hypothetical protein VHC20_02310 [Candidatus Paceibacterota bacterium]|nr:hypothetical protein [Candidatus Paceibacterota bacterium]